VRELEELLMTALNESPRDELRLPRSLGALANVSNLTPPPPPPSKRLPTKEELVAALDREGGSVLRVAERMELGRNVIYRLMAEFGIRGKKEDTAK
jgi:transcriptional regulator of acetoin/glycerol metabolism